MDLGSGRWIFVLLGERDLGLWEDVTFPPYLVLTAFKQYFVPKADPLTAMRVIKDKRPRAQLPTELWPMLVLFRDVNDRLSVEQVEPNNSAATLGPDILLRGITIEITDDPPTKNIRKVLPWLEEIERRGQALDGTGPVTTTQSLKSNLGSLAFSRWGI